VHLSKINLIILKTLISFLIVSKVYAQVQLSPSGTSTYAPGRTDKSYLTDKDICHKATVTVIRQRTRNTRVNSNCYNDPNQCSNIDYQTLKNT